MSIVVMIVLAMIVAFVAIDVIARREPRERHRAEAFVTTEKIIVDLTRRR